MPREEGERFEALLELERSVEELRAGHAARPPSETTPAQARIFLWMRSLTRLHLESTPGPAFVAALQARLEQELHQPAKNTTVSFSSSVAISKGQR